MTQASVTRQTARPCLQITFYEKKKKKLKPSKTDLNLLCVGFSKKKKMNFSPQRNVIACHLDSFYFVFWLLCHGDNIHFIFVLHIINDS